MGREEETGAGVAPTRASDPVSTTLQSPTAVVGLLRAVVTLLVSCGVFIAGELERDEHAITLHNDGSK